MPASIDRVPTIPSSTPDRAAKAAAACDLGEQVRSKDPARTLELADEALAIAIAIPDSELRARATWLKGTALEVAGRYNEALDLLKESVDLYDDVGMLFEKHKAMHSLAVVHRRQGNHVQAYSLVQENLAYFERIRSDVGIIDSCTTLGNMFKDLGDFERSLRFHFRALELIRKQSDWAGWRESITLTNIGNVYKHGGNFAEALAHYDRAQELAEETSHPNALALALTNKSSTLFELDRLDDAHAITTRALAVAREVSNLALEVSSLGMLGRIQNKLGKSEDACAFLGQARDLSEAQHAMIPMLSLEIELARVHLAMGKNEHAQQLAIEVRRRAEEMGHRELFAEALLIMHDVSKRLGDFKASLSYHEQFHKLRTEIAGVESQKAMANQRLTFELQQAEQQREVLRLRNERLELEMEHKKKDLTLLALQLNQKNELLDAVRKELMSLNTAIKGKASKASAITERTLDEVMSNIESNLKTEDDWKLFEEQFKSVNSTFFQRIAELYPSLTPNEIKVSALLKMNFASKEIARVMNVSVRAVETYRYRIRAKLGLDTRSNLVTHLAAI